MNRDHTLRLPRDTELPDICIRCGSPHELRLRIMALEHTPLLAYFLVFGGLLATVLGQSVLVKRVELTASVCEYCDSRRRWSRRLRFVALLALASPLGVVIAAPDRLEAMLVSIPFAVIAFFVTSIWSVRWQGIALADADARSMTIRGASPSVVETLERSTRS